MRARVCVCAACARAAIGEVCVCAACVRTVVVEVGARAQPPRHEGSRRGTEPPAAGRMPRQDDDPGTDTDDDSDGDDDIDAVLAARSGAKVFQDACSASEGEESESDDPIMAAISAQRRLPGDLPAVVVRCDRSSSSSSCCDDFDGDDDDIDAAVKSRTQMPPMPEPQPDPGPDGDADRPQSEIARLAGVINETIITNVGGQFPQGLVQTGHARNHMVRDVVRQALTQGIPKNKPLGGP